MTGPISFGAQLAAIIDDAYAAADVADTRLRVLGAGPPRLSDAVIDLGCGPGHMTQLLARSVGPTGRVDGVDVSAEMLARADAKCAGMPQVTHHEANILDLPFENSSFDAAFAMQALSFVEPLGGALTEIRRVLKPTGRLLILDTDYASLVWESDDRSRMERVMRAYDEHCVWPDLPRRLPAVLRNAGWHIAKTEALPMLATELGPNTLVHGVIDLWRDYVVRSGRIEAADADAWLNEQRARSDAGTFFFCLNRFLFVATPQ